MTDKLLPCPFCGGKAYIAGKALTSHEKIICRSCQASTCELYKNTDGLVATWNTRPAPKAIDVEALAHKVFMDAEAGIKISKDGARHAVNYMLRHGHINSRGLFGQPDRAETASAGDAEIHPDDRAVDIFAHLMKVKLSRKRKEGRRGWEGCDAEFLSKMLHEHVSKGDPVDVANFCMMLKLNQQSILPLAQTPTATDAEASAVRLDEQSKDLFAQKALEYFDGLEAGLVGIIPDEWLIHFKTLRAALSRMAPQWQTIDTAPSDQKILLYVANAYVQGHVRTGVIIDGVTYSYFDDGEDAGMMTEVFATHWMLLPAPPADRQG